MPDDKPKEINININMDPETIKGVHAQDVIVSRTNADMCLTFFVKDPTGQQAFVTARVFLPLTTAMQLSDLIKKMIGPSYDEYHKIIKNLPPPAGEITS